MKGKEFRARITSKNQLTLPAGVSALLHVGPGDSIRFAVDDDGAIVISPPTVRERLAPLVGRRRVGTGKTRDEIDREIREARGPRDE
jgi:AbrB family looped-hinge helix DNA binding protein